MCQEERFLKSKNKEITEALKNLRSDIVEATVKATTSWGIFLDYKNIDMLLHVSDLSHGRGTTFRPCFNSQKLKVKITKIDPKTNRVSASVKALTEDPYENIEKKYQEGKIYEGTVTKLQDYGAFIQLEPGIEGLVHQSN